MKATLGQPVIVENVTGAGGSLGVQRVARSAPDGYTVSIGHLNSHVFTGAVLQPVVRSAEGFGAGDAADVGADGVRRAKRLSAEQLKELIAWMKEHPKGAAFGSVGVGGPAKVWATDFQKKLGIEFQFVPYRGAAAIVQDLIAGQIDLACVEASNVVAHLQRRQDQVLCRAVGSRWAAAPDIPTIDEAGLPGFHMTFWHGLWVPAARRRTRSPSSTPRRSMRWPIRRCGRGLRRPGRTSCRASSRRRRRSAPTTRPRSRNGGRSSRRPASRPSDGAALCPAAARTFCRDWTAMLTFRALAAPSLLRGA